MQSKMVDKIQSRNEKHIKLLKELPNFKIIQNLDTKDWNKLITIDLMIKTSLKSCDMFNQSLHAFGIAKKLNRSKTYLKRLKTELLSIKSLHRLVENEIEIFIGLVDQRSYKSQQQVFFLLNQLLKFLNPKILIGYGIKTFDIPFLATKVQELRKNMNYLFYIDKLLQATFCIDLYAYQEYFIGKNKQLKNKYETPYLSLSPVLQHPFFKNLPFKRANFSTPLIFTPDGKLIYNFWLDHDQHLINHISMEVYNQLLIIEKLGY